MASSSALPHQELSAGSLLTLPRRGLVLLDEKVVANIMLNISGLKARGLLRDTRIRKVPDFCVTREVNRNGSPDESDFMSGKEEESKVFCSTL